MKNWFESEHCLVINSLAFATVKSKKVFPSPLTKFCQCLTASQLGLACTWWAYRGAYHLGNPFLHKDIELLESVQKFAFRVCTKRWREPHNNLRNLLKLPLLKDRRKKLKLTMVYKCLNGLTPSNFSFPVNRLETKITWKHISVSANCTLK